MVGLRVSIERCLSYGGRVHVMRLVRRELCMFQALDRHPPPAPPRQRDAEGGVEGEAVHVGIQTSRLGYQITHVGRHQRKARTQRNIAEEETTATLQPAADHTPPACNRSSSHPSSTLPHSPHTCLRTMGYVDQHLAAALDSRMRCTTPTHTHHTIPPSHSTCQHQHRQRHHTTGRTSNELLLDSVDAAHNTAAAAAALNNSPREQCNPRGLCRGGRTLDNTSAT